MNKCIVYFSFLILGVNYLLPFNTFINTYPYYTDIVGDLVEISPEKLLLIVNSFYQITSIFTNSLSTLKIIRITRHERTIGIISGSLSVIIFLSLGLIVWMRLKGMTQIILLISLSALSSTLQSIIDNTNLFFTNMFTYKKSLLLYASGINLSGTIHAIILILITLANFQEDFFLFTTYYIITGIILLSTPIIYGFIFKTTHRPCGFQNLSRNDSELSWNKKGTFLIILTCLNFIITLFIYPSILLRFEDREPLPFKQFNNVMVFLGYNITALSGNMLALAVRFRSIKYIVVGILIRILISAGSVYLKTIYPLDIMYVIFHGLCIFLHGFTSGFLISNIFYMANNLRNSVSNNILLIRLINLAVSIGLLIGIVISFIVNTCFLYSYEPLVNTNHTIY